MNNNPFMINVDQNADKTRATTQKNKTDPKMVVHSHYNAALKINSVLIKKIKN